MLLTTWIYLLIPCLSALLRSRCHVSPFPALLLPCGPVVLPSWSPSALLSCRLALLLSCDLTFLFLCCPFRVLCWCPLFFYFFFCISSARLFCYPAFLNSGNGWDRSNYLNQKDRSNSYTYVSWYGIWGYDLLLCCCHAVLLCVSSAVELPRS